MSPDTHIPGSGTATVATRQIVVDIAAANEVDRVRDVGGADLSSLAKGQPLEFGHQIAGVLFAVCPSAHAAAYLGAVETELGLLVEQDWLLARSQVVLCETLAACVWRHALNWPQLAGHTANLSAVKKARDLAAEGQRVLFPDGWQKIGGVQPVTHQAKVTDAIQELGELACETAKESNALMSACPSYLVKHRCTPLGDAILTTNASSAQHEETALSQSGPTGPQPLRAWFEAQTQYVHELVERMHKPNSLSEFARGVVDTARGRLMHKVSIQNNTLVDWQVVAPTDWNFAPSGPCARALEGVRSLSLAKWVVQAFDPCAPVQFVGESNHA